MEPASPPRPAPPWLDRWVADVGLAGRPAAVRRARVVVASGALLLVGYALLAAGLVAGGAPLAPRVQIAAAALATALAVGLVRWGGRVRAAAALLTLSLTASALLQSAFDAGIRDPALGLLALAPLVAAMTSGARLALANAVVGIAGVLALYAAGTLGAAAPPASTADQLDVYAALIVSCVALASALAGVLYDRHVGRALSEAEGEAARLRDALRASDARHRSLFDHIPVGMYRTSLGGEVLLANASLARMIGAASADAACGLNVAAVYADPQDLERFGALVRRDGEVRRFEARWRAPDGGTRHVRISGRAAVDADGAPLYHEGTVEDITAEREAREALFQSEARFRALVQRSTDVVVVVDRAGRLTYVSPSVTGLLGRSPESLVGTNMIGVVHPDDRDEAAAAVEAAAVVHGARAEIRVCHAEGHFVFVEAAGTPLYDDPSVRGLVLNLRDVTERKRAQAVLVQAKRQAEEVALLKSTFLANMSHEIRTPLTAILGFSDVLAEEIGDPHLREFADLIARSGRRLMDTLNSVLDLARLEAGRGDLEACPVDVTALAEETAEMLRPTAVDKGLALEAVVERRPLVSVLDEAALARVLHNLVANAIKFTPEGSVTVAARSEGRSVVVEVRDTGIGIEEAFLPSVFGEFEQESSGTERTHDGAGLGLAISRQLVERMDGTISVASEKGVGTTFTITFPAVGAEPDGPDRRPLVLVVDDQPQAREVARRALGDRFRVALAESGPAAMEAVAEERPVAVVLDIHLGRSISGEDVMRTLRETPAFAGLPLVAVTAYALSGDRARFLAKGFDAYVRKPYDRGVLVEAVMQAIFDRDEAAADRPAPPAALAGADHRFVARTAAPLVEAGPRREEV
ncbi:PAS domain S-box protein [Rubrivirga litoralis]|uniref:histidine kinase n=1 Tax=Rubrivirga litoralis TaxID=3075598 RepID=A0ABU3BQU4_9BACT|nr:PAS domain S-box protein [Rubrivirga sp. F394]MDT0631644.1 PAS domain S-box protein [Rubrivirga sp. F394]